MINEYEYDERLELDPLFADCPSLESLGINEDHEWRIWEAECKAALMETEQFIDNVSWWRN